MKIYKHKYLPFEATERNNDYIIENKINSFIISPKSTIENSNEWEQINKEFLITEDGVKLFRDSNFVVYWIDKTFEKIRKSSLISSWNQLAVNSAIKEIQNGYKYFVDLKKAEEYFIYNKPCLSINDVAKIYVTANRKEQPVMVNEKRVMKMGKQPEGLLNLVKEKLKV